MPWGKLALVSTELVVGTFWQEGSPVIFHATLEHAEDG